MDRVRGIAVAALLVVSTLLSGPAASAQSLAEVAKQEAERRGTLANTGKVYTNNDLTPDFTRPPAPAPEPTTGALDASSAQERTLASTDATDGEPSPADQEGVTPPDEQQAQPANDKGEEYWRGRAELIRARLAAQNAQIEALRQRMAAFTDGSADPERAIAAAAFAKAQTDLVALNQEWLRFENQARERKIPDAWIR
jgi:hypothetical protein